MQTYLTGYMVSKCIPAGWSLYFRPFRDKLDWSLIMNVKQLAKLLHEHSSGTGKNRDQLCQHKGNAADFEPVTCPV